MSLETMGLHFDEWPRLQDSPEYQKQLEERVKKVEKDQKYALTLTKANDVLTVLDLPDEQDNILRKTLIKLDNNTLESLVKKSKNEILTFIFKEQKRETFQDKQSAKEEVSDEIEKQKSELQEKNERNERIENKISKIKWAFTPEILSNNPDIAQNFEALNTAETTEQKEAILRGILNILKNDPWKLKSIVESLWWANPNNPQYQEFKNTLIWIDKSFEPIFADLEATNIKETLNTDKITNDITKESWWALNFDLKANPPISKLSLEWNAYSFDEKIDMKALNEIMSLSKNELTKIQNSYAVLNDFDKSFNNLLWNIQKIWGKDNFRENLKAVIDNYSRDIFIELNKTYNDIKVPSNMQIDEFEIDSFNDIRSPDELQLKIKNIEHKLIQIKDYITSSKNQVESNFEWEVKELLQKEPQKLEKQKEVLKFVNNCGFGELPKELTDKIIKNIQTNNLMIPGLDLDPKNIDLKNGHFGESSVFSNSDNWLNTMAKTNLVKFVNKVISGDTNEPLNVEAIVNGVTVVNPSTFKNDLAKAWIVDGMGWKYSKIVENLRKDEKI